MGAALSIFVLMSVSVLIMRVAAVALRHTGLSDTTARFQALSAFTGTGFTTSEAETLVNYPIRRRIVSILIVIGNMGLLTVMATLVASLVHTDGEVAAVVTQLAWLVGGMALLWFLMLNKTADRVLCAWIGEILDSTTFLGQHGFHRLLQVGDGLSVCEHPVPMHWVNDQTGSVKSQLDTLDLVTLSVRSLRGAQTDSRLELDSLTSEDSLLLFGRDNAHEALSDRSSTAHIDSIEDTQ